MDSKDIISPCINKNTNLQRKYILYNNKKIVNLKVAKKFLITKLRSETLYAVFCLALSGSLSGHSPCLPSADRPSGLRSGRFFRRHLLAGDLQPGSCQPEKRRHPDVRPPGSGRRSRMRRRPGRRRLHHDDQRRQHADWHRRSSYIPPADGHRPASFQTRQKFIII